MTHKKGFSLLECILSLAIICILSLMILSMQKTLTKSFVYDSIQSEQNFQVQTALDCIRLLSLQAYQVEIKPANLENGPRLRLLVKENDKTKGYDFYVNRYSGILYETITAESSPGTVQLALGIEFISFYVSTHSHGLLLRVLIQAKGSDVPPTQRSFYLRNCLS